SKSASPLLEDDDDFYLDDIPDDTGPRENKVTIISIYDLPDELLLRIFKLANEGKGLRMRLVSKKMEQRVLSMYPFNNIELHVSSDRIQLNLNN
ncbi:hypothetical protein PMAYCL1PPCAC_20628, partial [Pristionchus mayeri]